MKTFITLLNTTQVSGTVFPSQLPNGFEINYENDDWYSAKSNSTFFHLRLMIDGNDIGYPSKGVFAVCGKGKIIGKLWDKANGLGLHVWTINQLRNDISSIAQTIKGAWKSDQFISGSSLQSLTATIAGASYPSAIESTIDRVDLDSE